LANTCIRLKNNWIDTLEALLSLTPETVDKLNFPLMLKQKLNQKIAELKEGGGSQTHHSSGQVQKKMDIEEESTPQQDIEADPQLKGNLENCLNELAKSVLGTENLLNTLNVMGKLVQNPLTNPEDPKFRVINLQNKKIQMLVGSQKPSLEFFMRLGFFKNKEGNLVLEGQKRDFCQSLTLGKETLALFVTKYSMKD